MYKKEKNETWESKRYQRKSWMKNEWNKMTLEESKQWREYFDINGGWWVGKREKERA